MARYLLATTFLCLLVNSCNARLFRKHTGVLINQTHKEIEKLGGKVVIVDDQEGAVSDDQKPRKRLRRSRRNITEGKKHEGNAEAEAEAAGAGAKFPAVEKKSMVSWHVRPPKQHDQLPGIYSDYPKPRSRPPSHN